MGSTIGCVDQVGVLAEQAGNSVVGRLSAAQCGSLAGSYCWDVTLLHVRVWVQCFRSFRFIHTATMIE